MKHLKYVWWALCVLVLAISVWTFSMTPSGDSEIFLIYGMLALSFPLGLLFPLVATSMQSAGIVLPAQASLPWLFLEWAVFLALGWFQWSKLIPWCVRKLGLART